MCLCIILYSSLIIMKMKQNKTLKDNLNDRKMRNKRDRQ